jgi:hypothetical protein
MLPKAMAFEGFLAAVAMAALVGCDAQQGSIGAPAPAAMQPTDVSADQMPGIDARSPDTVVKSWWALTDWIERHEEVYASGWHITLELDKYLQTRIALTTGDALSWAKYERAQTAGFFQTKDNSKKQYDREIIEVKNESDTRAIVLAKFKNVTPIPDAAKLGEADQEDRNYGRDVRYLVEKTKDGWRLAQAWERDVLELRMAELEKKNPDDSWKRVWNPPPESAYTSPSAFNYTETPSP